MEAPIKTEFGFSLMMPVSKGGSKQCGGKKSPVIVLVG